VPRPDAKPRRAAVIAVAAVVILAVVGAGTYLGHVGPFARSIARLEVDPAGALLTGAGQTRQLHAFAVDASGARFDAPVTWKALKPATIDVDASGTVTAKALGSGQIVAVSGTVTSAPVLVVAAVPAAGVILIVDDQIVGQPAATDPAAQPSLTNTYRVTLSGVSVAVGDRLVGTGAKPVAGEVVAVDGATATLKLVPLPELFPALSLDEVVDLSAATFEVASEIARLYEVTRTGTTFDFRPKPNFDELVRTSSLPVAGRHIASIGGAFDLGPADGPLFAGGAVGTTALPPFTECKVETTPSSEASPLSLGGSTPPSYSITVNPQLTLLYTAETGFEKFVVSAAPVVKITATLKVAVAFEGKFGCEVELGRFIFPGPGVLALALGAIVPIKVGFEVGGKVTLASVELGAEATAQTSVELGVVCPGGGECEVDSQMADVTTTWLPKVDGPSLTDLRLEPGLELFGAVDVLIGSPFIDQLQFNLVRAKASARLGADWAPRRIQIADAAYASNYKLTVEGGVKVGPKLTDIAALLGLADIASREYKASRDVATSPTGKLELDRAAYAAGDTGTAHVTLDEPTVRFLGGYQVARILLVRHTPSDDPIIATVDASADQKEFDLPFTASAALTARELHAFVVTKFPSLDTFALELASPSTAKIAFVSDRDGGVATYVMNPDGTEVQRLGPVALTETPAVREIWRLQAGRWSGDGKEFLWCAATEGLWLMNRDGGNARRLLASCGFTDLSPDGTRLAFGGWRGPYVTSTDSAALPPSNPDFREAASMVTWAPDGARMAYLHVYVEDNGDVAGTTTIRCSLDITGADGGWGATIVDKAAMPGPENRGCGALVPGGLAWSPDASQIAFCSTSAAFPGSHHIYVVSASGGSPRELGVGCNPTWSPDGTQIAFGRFPANTAGGPADIWTMNADGTNKVKIVDNAAEDVLPIWIAKWE
jgi:hypothetical protein